MTRVALTLSILLATFLAGAAHAQTPEYQPIALDSIRQDGARWAGRKVEISGLIHPMGNRLALTADTNDRDARLIDPGKLTRDQVDAIAMKCAGGCRGVVRGTVARVGLQPGIVADTISAP
jgi:hypothetical protein